MRSPYSAPINLRATIERWPFVTPFTISGYQFDAVEVLLVTLEMGRHIGRGEAAGVYYRNDRPSTMLKEITAMRGSTLADLTRESLQKILPASGARNAIDCALWDLEAKIAGTPVWRLAGLESTRPIVTTFSCGADEPALMAAAATRYSQAQAIKLKLTGEEIDMDRVRAVRESRPDVWLGVDANQGFTPAFLERAIPVLVDAGVSLIEQPFAIGEDEQLERLESPIPIAADESFQAIADLERLVGRFDAVNIKLDKCGGLSEALRIVRRAHELGLSTMVGNMFGTSLAMAPAFLVGQFCDVVDLDGPVFLRDDRNQRVDYSAGFITCPEEVWGGTGR